MNRSPSRSRSLTLIGLGLAIAAVIVVAWLLRSEPPPGADSLIDPGSAPARRPGDAVAELPRSDSQGIESLEAHAAVRDFMDSIGSALDYPGHAVRGRLVREDGGALPRDLAVRATLQRPYPHILQSLTQLRPDTSLLKDGAFPPQVHRATRTLVDADGRFQMENVPDGGAWLEVEHDRLYPGVPVRLDVTDEELQIVLVLGARILGRVLAPDGTPVDGAEVSARSPMDPYAILDTAVRFVRVDNGESDADGLFVLTRVPPDEPLDVVVKADDRFEVATLTTPPLAPGSDHEVEVALSPGASVSGRVVDEQGAPVADARLMLLPTSLDVSNLNAAGKVIERTERTDDEGRFTFGALVPARYRLSLAGAGYRAEFGEPFELTRGEQRSGLEILARRGLSVSGRVTDPGGAGLAGARIQAARPPSMMNMRDNMDRQLREWTRGEDDGTFTLFGYDDGAVRVWASAPGFVSSHVDARAGDADVTLALEPKLSLSGMAVRLTDAEPLQDYTLWAVPSSGLFDVTRILEMEDRVSSLPGALHVRDELGRFLMEDVPPDVYDLVVTAEGHARTVVEDVVASSQGATGDIVILVAEEARVTGEVVSGRTGLPLPGAVVTTGRTDIMSAAQQWWSSPPPKTVTDAAGGFSLGGLGREKLLITVRHAAHVDLGLPPLTLEPGEVRDLGLLRLSAGAAVYGTITDEHRRPVPGVQVLVGDLKGTTFKRTHADAEGAWRIEGLLAGSYNVTRMDFSFDMQAENPASYLNDLVSRPVALGQDEEKRVDLAIDSGEGARLEGTVRSTNGPEGGAMTWIVSDEGSAQLRFATTDANGHYEIDGLQPGRYLLQITPSSDVAVGTGSQPTAPVTELVTIGSDPVQRHDVRLPGGSLDGVVVDKRSGEELRGVRVLLERTDDGRPRSRILEATGGRSGEAYTDGGGSFRFDHLASGTYTILAGGTNILGLGEAGWSTTRLEDVSVSESRANFRVRIELERGGAISGLVKDTRGEPLGGIPLWARDDRTARWQSMLSETNTDPTGAYTLSSLEPGPWTLAAGGTTHALTLSRSVAVRRDATAELDLVLLEGVEVWCDPGAHDPRELAFMLLSGNSAVPHHLTSLDGLMQGQQGPLGIRLGRFAPGSYTLSVGKAGDTLQTLTIVLAPGSGPRSISLE